MLPLLPSIRLINKRKSFKTTVKNFDFEIRELGEVTKQNLSVDDA